MSPVRAWDVAVIGGGIVGVATARALQSRGIDTTVVEAEPELARHQSGRNSGVLHSGLYYRPGSQKALLTTSGREAMVAYCEERGLPWRRCGKLVLATREDELERLDELERRGRANGLEDLRRLGPQEIRHVEPAAAGLAGLWVEETGVVNFQAVVRSMAGELNRQGGGVRTATRVVSVRRQRGLQVLETPSAAIRCRSLVNCAGLQSDRVARLCGLDPGVRIIPFRGEYWQLAPEAAAKVRGLIYPVPDPCLPFLDVHLTRTVDDVVEAGPNAVLAFSREGYDWGTVSARDLVESLGWPGFWKMARSWWRTGLGEMHRSLSRDRFARDLARLVPSIRPRDLRPGSSGVRAQAVDREGRLLDDFHWTLAERQVHVVNAPSPAATASIAIAEAIADKVEEVG